LPPGDSPLEEEDDDDDDYYIKRSPPKIFKELILQPSMNKNEFRENIFGDSV
jgi:hypothetical protein